MVVVGRWPYRPQDLLAKHSLAGFSCPYDSEVEIARVSPNPEYTSLVSLAHNHLGPARGHRVLPCMEHRYGENPVYTRQIQIQREVY